jgi:hypothetical protein
MSSPVQTIYAEGKVSIIKKVVCLKACRELHAVGALTDYLLPESSVPCEDEPDIGISISLLIKNESRLHFIAVIVNIFFVIAYT